MAPTAFFPIHKPYGPVACYLVLSTHSMRSVAFCCSLALLMACGQPTTQTDIDRLEASLVPDYRITTIDSLVTLYRKTAKEHPDDHALCAQYLSRAAQLQYAHKGDAVSAVQWIDDVLGHHADGQNLTVPVGTLAHIWYAYLYKTQSAIRLQPDAIDKMRAQLEQHQVWIDSALLRLDKEMGNPVVENKEKAREFIEIAEAYANIVEGKNRDKAVDLYLMAAGLAKTVDNPNKALQMYYQVAEKLPQHAKAPTALFMMGHIYENDMNDLERARSAYQTFLERYPNDPDYTDDAQMALKQLGKSPEELVEEFERLNKVE